MRKNSINIEKLSVTLLHFARSPIEWYPPLLSPCHENRKSIIILIDSLFLEVGIFKFMTPYKYSIPLAHQKFLKTM